MLLPYAEDIRNAAAGTLADIDQIEHLNQRAVSRVGNAAALSGFHINAESAWVGERDDILFLDDNKTLSAVVTSYSDRFSMMMSTICLGVTMKGSMGKCLMFPVTR